MRPVFSSSAPPSVSYSLHYQSHTLTVTVTHASCEPTADGPFTTQSHVFCANPSRQRCIILFHPPMRKVLRSIGYKGLPLGDPLPFNINRGVFENENSRIKNEKGLYCAGWIRRGPVGVILDTMTDGSETGKVILSDIKSGILGPVSKDKRDVLLRSLESKVVTFSDWKKIDKAEAEAGEKVGKPREKITDIEQMIKIAKS
ncbi:NADPH:adrenodoxin oxidoreductase, mitochondrial [Plakobranchus ocellatus]|uniref:NADPH:adrenodoxin oxidoreductase, mitochondrial n=1 Tax=Plakobranchus ocellatus TaxID=259542 RepID=A0AAV3YGA0_9GAST|nr:NADPH:adrenodoxin oxidoreductase, mitochondrial [Plakobranchus ocellatus]